MSPYEIRVIGDPVLKQKATDVGDVDGALVQLCDDMIQTMYDAPGLGLAAPQVGVQKRLFVYDLQDEHGPKVLVNPTIVESRGEWEYHEGCLSIPGLYFDIVRPKEVHIRGYDLDGNEVDLEADELEARLFQHEFDHLEGVLMTERLDADQRKEARKAVRELMLTGRAPSDDDEPPRRGGLSLR